MTANAENNDDSNSLYNQKIRLNNKYFIYDTQQKQSIANNIITGWYTNSHQNYMIPSDLFRYCSNIADLSDVLSNLNWYRNEIVIDDLTGKYSVNTTNILNGLFGRIPSKLLNSLTGSTTFNGIFKNTHFDAFVGLRGTSSLSLIRGIAYPEDLFTYNTALVNISDMFYNTIIPVGVDINSNLFSKLSELRTVSNV